MWHRLGVWANAPHATARARHGIRSLLLRITLGPMLRTRRPRLDATRSKCLIRMSTAAAAAELLCCMGCGVCRKKIENLAAFTGPLICPFFNLDHMYM